MPRGPGRQTACVVNTSSSGHRSLLVVEIEYSAVSEVHRSIATSLYSPSSPEILVGVNLELLLRADYIPTARDIRS